MAMKLSTVRGTPIHHIDASKGLEGGRGSGKPAGMVGTVHKQYDSDRRGYQSDSRGGTPYHSQEGNPPNDGRVVARGTNLESDDHGNQNDPHSNGRSVMLGVGEQAGGYVPPHEPSLDSPVPGHAPRFEPDFIAREDAAHLGTGIEHLAGHNNDLQELDGVMSRGLDSTSHPDEDELEMTRDDTLRGPEAGTQQDVSGHTHKRIRE